MKGRQENTLKIENRIKELLKYEPQILSDFFYSLIDKTANTKRVYIRYISDFLKFCDNDYLNMKRSDINRYMEEIRYRTDKNGNLVENGASIRRARLAAINCFYEYLLDMEMVESNPCDRIKPPTLNQEKEVVYMTPDEIQLLKSNIKWDKRNKKWKNRDLAIISLGCSTGLRVTAISEINIEDIDFDNNSITVIEKGNKERVVYFGSNTKRTLKAWLRDREKMESKNKDAFFISQKGGRIGPRTIYDIVSKYTADFDKHITPHKMRSSCGTNLYEQTRDVYLVQQVLGHKNIANTKRYTHISTKERKHAADILDSL